MKKVLGVTGRIGSGKTTVCNELAFKFGYSIISVDVIRYALMKHEVSPEAVEFRTKLAESFNLAIKDENSFLDYDELSKCIFKSKDCVQQCANIMTPYIKNRIVSELAKIESGCVAIEWAYLIEHGYLDLVDKVLIVQCSDAEFEVRQLLLSCSIADAITRRALEPTDEQRVFALKSVGMPYVLYQNNNYDFSALNV